MRPVFGTFKIDRYFTALAFFVCAFNFDIFLLTETRRQILKIARGEPETSLSKIG